MIEKRDLPQRSLTALNYAIITLLALVCLYHCIHVLAASFNDPVQLIRHRGALLCGQLDVAHGVSSFVFSSTNCQNSSGFTGRM